MAMDRKKRAKLLTGVAVLVGIVAVMAFFYVFVSTAVDATTDAAVNITKNKDAMAWFNASVSTLKTWHLIAMLAITALLARS